MTGSLLRPRLLAREIALLVLHFALLPALLAAGSVATLLSTALRATVLLLAAVLLPALLASGGLPTTRLAAVRLAACWLPATRLAVLGRRVRPGDRPRRNR
ncbi:hypothetical protein NONI108955_23845 [Nocardia ninae]|uniref:Uncharacterized protein n=1 Tax=Nocardia ninae NBRC 108245 TaxID=1210091 RepID=A0A511MNY2_9NOCA|nr:hypothetical protein NN4_68380 [Nocardia ninae NBRC 108245]